MKVRFVYACVSIAVAFVFSSELACAVETQKAIPSVHTCVGREATLKIQIQDSKLVSVSVTGGLRYVVQSPEPTSKLADQTLLYEFIVDDSYDTNTFYSFGIRNGLINSRQIFQNGNDSDTYRGWLVAEGDEAFVCN